MELYGQRARQVTARIDDLEFDEGYQRPEVERIIRAIIATFNSRALGGIVVNRRTDGALFVIDGRQRLTALKRLGHEMAEILLLEGLTVKEEAELFIDLNGRRKSVEALELFKARMSYGEPMAVEIAATVERNGYRVQKNYGAQSDGIAAVRALESIYKAGGAPLLDRTLRIIRAAWPDDRGSTHHPTIAGLGMFLKRYDGLFSENRLIERLSTRTPGSLLRKANADVAYGKGLDHAFALEVAALYNYRVHPRHRLPSWEDAPARQQESALRMSA